MDFFLATSASTFTRFQIKVCQELVLIKPVARSYCFSDLLDKYSKFFIDKKYIPWTDISHSLIISWAIDRTLIEVCIFIYLCSAQKSFKSNSN